MQYLNLELDDEFNFEFFDTKLNNNNWEDFDILDNNHNK